jgi:hypothetical protein
MGFANAAFGYFGCPGGEVPLVTLAGLLRSGGLLRPLALDPGESYVACRVVGGGAELA